MRTLLNYQTGSIATVVMIVSYHSLGRYRDLWEKQQRGIDVDLHSGGEMPSSEGSGSSNEQQPKAHPHPSHT